MFWGGREGTEAGVGQGPARRARALPRGDRPPRRLLRRAGLRPALRARAEAQRAARRHLPADGRPRAALHLDAAAPRDGRRQPRGRARDHGRPLVPARRRAGAVGGQALPHRPQRAGRRPLRPGLPLRRRGPQGGVPARAAARERGLRRPAPLRRPRLPQRGRRGRVGLRRGLHAHLSGARGARAPLRRPAGGAGGARRGQHPRARPALGLRRRRRRAEGGGRPARRAGEPRLLQRAPRPAR